MTVAFVRSKAPDKFDREREADTLAEAMWRGHSIVGFAPDLGWLPPDLVTAADHRLLVSPLHVEAASEVARRLTGTEPTVRLTAVEAAAAGPRVLRLASRPQQTADQYFRKLRDLRADGWSRTSASCHGGRRCSRSAMASPWTCSRAWTRRWHGVPP